MVLSALAGLIPKIEGFAPLPSATADAFMSMQGGHMALYFGALYKFGTRFVDSMPNEEFNRMKADPTLLIKQLEPTNKAITQAFIDHVVDPNNRRTRTRKTSFSFRHSDRTT